MIENKFDDTACETNSACQYFDTMRDDYGSLDIPNNLLLPLLMDHKHFPPKTKTLYLLILVMTAGKNRTSFPFHVDYLADCIELKPQTTRLLLHDLQAKYGIIERDESNGKMKGKTQGVIYLRDPGEWTIPLEPDILDALRQGNNNGRDKPKKRTKRNLSTGQTL